MCKCIKRERVVAEVRNVEYSFGVRQIQSSQICVEACFGGAKIRNSRRRADASTGLPKAPLAQVSSVKCMSCTDCKHTNTTIFFAPPLLMYSATDSTVLLFSVSGGTLSSMGVEDSWPILRKWALDGFLYIVCKVTVPYSTVQVGKASTA